MQNVDDVSPDNEQKQSELEAFLRCRADRMAATWDLTDRLQRLAALIWLWDLPFF